MPVGRTYRAQVRLPIQLASVDRSRSYDGETVDLSTGGFSAELRTDDRLPTIVEALIRFPHPAGALAICKGQLAWQGGLMRGAKRVSYRIIAVSLAHREKIECVVHESIQRLMTDLREWKLFAGAAAGDIEHLLALARVRETQSGKSLYELGRYEGAGAYLLLDGRVAIERPGHSAGLAPGRLFGCWAAPEIRPHIESARAITRARFLYLPAPLHREVTATAPNLAAALRNALDGVGSDSRREREPAPSSSIATLG